MAGAAFKHRVEQHLNGDAGDRKKYEVMVVTTVHQLKSHFRRLMGMEGAVEEGVGLHSAVLAFDLPGGQTTSVEAYRFLRDNADDFAAHRVAMLTDSERHELRRQSFQKAGVAPPYPHMFPREQWRPIFQFLSGLPRENISVRGVPHSWSEGSEPVAS